MTNEDYKLEELENAAVNKSNNAKRIAAAAGILLTGGAAGYAATTLAGDSDADAVTPLTTEDIDGVAEKGADQVQETTQNTQNTQPQTVHEVHEVHHIHHVAPTPPPATSPNDLDVTINKTTHYYDDDLNKVGSTQEGTINGKDFLLLDGDGDDKADILAYDANGNHKYENNEVMRLEGKDQIQIQDSGKIEVALLDDSATDDTDSGTLNPIEIHNEKDLADNDIRNDFEDEKTGESYRHDYAENNQDYDNGKADNYSAEVSAPEEYKIETNDVQNDFAYKAEMDGVPNPMTPDMSETVQTSGTDDYAFEEDAKSDTDYSELADNSSSEDSSDSFEDTAASLDDSSDSFDDFGTNDIGLA